MDIANAVPVLHADMKIGLPAFVKNAHWPTATEVDQLPATAFADGDRKFPIFSKAGAFCSALVAATGCDEKVLGRIADACVNHGIADDVLKYTGLFDSVKRAAAPVEMTHALVINANDFGVGDEGSAHMLPVGDHLEIEDSIGELDKAAADNKLPCELIREAAMNLMKVASENDVAVPRGSVVDRLGHERLPDYEKAAFLIQQRMSVVNAEAMEQYKEVVEFLKTAGMEQNVIDGLRDLDAQHAVDYGFGKASLQPTPWEIVFCGPNDNDVVKMAASHVLVADCPIPTEALISVSDKAIDQRFRKESADLVKQAKAAQPHEATSIISGLSETQQVELLDLVLAPR